MLLCRQKKMLLTLIRVPQAITYFFLFILLYEKSLIED